MIQIRNVPDELHRRLKIRAAELGMSLSDYLKTELEYLATRPTDAEMAERLSRLEPIDLGDAAARAIRELRNAAE